MLFNNLRRSEAAPCCAISLFLRTTVSHSLLSFISLFPNTLPHPQKKATVFNNLKRAEAASTVLSFFQRQSQDENCCMLCKRHFQSEAEVGEFDWVLLGGGVSSWFGCGCEQTRCVCVL